MELHKKAVAAFAGVDNFCCPQRGPATMADAELTLAELRAEDRVVLRYVENPNGSVDDIAGICNEARNVVGLMPHPERASNELLGSTDGLPLLRALVA